MLLDYHVEGFERLKTQWEHVQQLNRKVNDDGNFISFLSYEMHSCEYGDPFALENSAE